MKIVTAFTEEADLADEAIAQLKAQIKPDENLLSHSLGIVHCHSDFLTGDTLKELMGAFDFPLIGGVSVGMAGPEGISGLGLSMTVLSSEEARFTVAFSEKITGENHDEEMVKLYSALVQGQGESPSALLFYAPFLMDVAPEHVLVSLGKAAENIPVFGALALSSSDQFADSYSFCGDKVLTSGVVLAAIFTKTPPSFYSVSVKYNRIMRLKDPITEVKSKTLLSIGGKTFKEYMEMDGSGASENLPYLFYGSDGSEIVRICHKITPEGYGVFTGEVPPDAVIAVCTGVSKEDIVETATELLGRIKEDCGEMSGCLIYSCMERRFLLGLDKNVELWAIQKVLGDKVFAFSYSGGEVFPQTLKTGRIINQLQNNTLIVCVFHE